MHENKLFKFIVKILFPLFTGSIAAKLTIFLFLVILRTNTVSLLSNSINSLIFIVGVFTALFIGVSCYVLTFRYIKNKYNI